MGTSKVSRIAAWGVAGAVWLGGPVAAGAGHHGEGGPEESEPACERVGDPTASPETLGVDLREWSVVPEADEVAEGTLTFLATNAGVEPHELVVVEGRSAEKLPTTDNGAFDEAAWGEDRIVGEIEEFPAGEDCSGTFHLEPGDYVLLCNIVEEEDGEVESHYQLGMHTSFRVTSGGQ